MRRAVLEYLYANPGEQSTSDIAEAVHHPKRTTERALEDLDGHGVVTANRYGSGKATTWEIADWAAADLTSLNLPRNVG